MSEYIVDFAAHNVNAAIALCDGVHGKIVRCRDCEFFVRDKLGECCTLMDFEHAGGMDDGYCAWGERKEANEDGNDD